MRRNREEWERIVRKQSRSGLTITEFAEEHGLNAGTLGFWRSKLGRADKDGMRVLPVAVTEVREAPDCATIELTRDGRIRAEITRSKDLELLVEVLSAMRAKSC